MQITSAFIGTLNFGATEVDVDALIAQWIADHSSTRTNAVLNYKANNVALPDQAIASGGNWTPGGTGLYGMWINPGQSYQIVFQLQGDIAAFWWCYYDETKVWFVAQVIDKRTNAAYGGSTYPKNNSSIVQEIFHGGDAISICVGPKNDVGSNRRFVIAPGEDDGPTRVIRMVQTSTDPSAEPYDYTTPSTGTVHYDDVRNITALCDVGIQGYSQSYWMEIGLDADMLGWDPATLAEDDTFRMDLQVIYGDNSFTVPARTHWWNTDAGPALATVDIPTEADLYEEFWGTCQNYVTAPVPPIVTAARNLIEDTNTELGPGVPITFTLAAPQKVSAVIREKAGNPRGRPAGFVQCELLRAKPYEAGTHTVYWNGYDRSGQPMAAGDYEVHIGKFDNCYVEYAGSAGNSAKPPYRTDDGLGSLGGIHAGPWSVAAGATGMYLCSAGEEGAFAFRKVGTDGVALWTTSMGVNGGAVAAIEDAAGDYVYIATTAQTLSKRDADTGDLIWSVSVGSFFTGGSGQYINAEGIAILNGKVYLSYYDKLVLKVVDIATQVVTELVIADEVTGLCAFDSTYLLACNGTKIVKIHGTTGVFTDHITGLGHAAAVWMQGTDIWVSDDHYTKNQVYKYNSGGSLVTTIGVLGGQTLGLNVINPPSQAYDTLKFGNVTAGGIGPDGNLWLCNKVVCPRRWAVVTTAGVWVKDVVGPIGFSTIFFNHDNHSRILMGCTGFSPNYIEVEVDFDADPETEQTFTILRIEHLSQNGIDETASPDLLWQGFNGAGIISQVGYGHGQIFTYTGADANATGRRYMYYPGGYQDALWIWDSGLDRWRFVCAIPKDSREYGLQNTPRGFWKDLDNDALVDGGETAAFVQYATGGFQTIQTDLTLCGDSGFLAPSNIDSNGIPTYYPGVFTSHTSEDLNTYRLCPPGATDGPVFFPSCFGNATDGTLVFHVKIGPEPRKSFHDDSIINNILIIRDGEVKNCFGKKDSYKRNDGDITSSLIGVAGYVVHNGIGVIVANDWNSIVCAWTDTGLALDWIVKETDLTGPGALYIENNQAGAFHYNDVLDAPVLIDASTEDMRWLKVLGIWEPGELTIENQDITLVTPQVRSAVTPTTATIAYDSWVVPNYDWPHGQGIEAYGWHWNETLSPVYIKDGDAIIAVIEMRRDANQFCIRAKVVTTETFPGSNETDPLAQFGTHAGIELMFGTTDNPSRTSPQQGDTRIFLTTQGTVNTANGRLEGTAIMCRPASTSLTGNSYMRYAKVGYDYLYTQGLFGGTAPEGTLDFSEFAEMPNSYVCGLSRFGGGSYTVHAEFPLAYLPDITEERLVAITRPIPGALPVSQTGPDLTGGLILFNVAVWIPDGLGGATRYAWRDDGFTGSDETQMNPSLWGYANGPLELMLDEDGDGEGIS